MIVASNWIYLYWGARSASDISPTPFVLASFLLFIKGVDSKSKKFLALSGFLAGAAFMCRFASAIYFVVTVLLTLAMRRWRDIVPYAWGFSIALFIQALLDVMVYGAPFSSPLVFLFFNLDPNKVLSLQYPSPPFFFYYCLFAIFGPLLYLSLVALLQGDWKTWFVFLNALSIIAAHSLFIHKEARYILTTIPLIAVVISYGTLSAQSRWEKVSCFLLVAVYLGYCALEIA